MRYGYKAYDAGGRLIEGDLVSDSREMAIDALHRRGVFPLHVAPGGIDRRQPWWNRELVVLRRRTMSQTALALFTRELATLVKGELPLDEALRIVALQPMLPTSVKRVTQAVLARVMEGQSLSQAMAAEGEMFPEFVWRLVRGGEASGSLGDVLQDLAGFLERSTEVKAKILSAMLYPVILLGVAGLTVAVIMGVLLPMIVPLLRDAGAPLPLIIRVLEGIRQTVADNAILAGLLAVAAPVAAIFLPRATAVRMLWSRLLLQIPVVNRLVAGGQVARFSRTLGTLLKSGVPLLEATRIAGGVLGNARYREAIETVMAALKEGAPLSRPMTASGLFPEIALRLITVGEQTGQLEAMLLRVADIFETMVQRQLDRFTTLLTPAMTLGIGLLVGGLMVSVMGALLSINELALK
jgi:general secretion pathway protein F